MSEDLLTVTGLTSGYEGTSVIRDVSLRVGPGEIVALLGANGAGKTTTLRVISGLIEAYSGSVMFGDVDVLNTRTQRLTGLGMSHVPDSRGIFPDLTVEEHFRLRSRKGADALGKVFETFPALEPIAGRRAGLLSGGEQQMLALSTALAREPKLLLVDELSLGLAPIVVETLLPVLRNYATDNNAGVLLVEQHVQLALGICDRGYVLSHGEMVMEGDGKQLRADRGLLIASYLGEARAPVKTNA